MTPKKGLVLGDRYELTERIAVGGMGEVWQAADLNLHRRVAAKVLRAEFAGDAAFLARMRTEARNAAGLSHVNVTAMYDYGEQEGSGYLVMELVEGEPLSELLGRERTLPAGQLLSILAQTARGLHAAHVAGVVHRDVKPSNLLITGDGTVKITDFGIALGANQAPMTAAGMVMGTAQYLPPEQAMGKPAQGVGDIYALGIIAYEALVGHRPFTGTTQVEIAFAHVNQAVPPMPDDIDERVREVVMSMLAKDPENRPRSGASLARLLDELQRHLQSEAARAEPSTRGSHREEIAALPTRAMPTTSGARESGARDRRIETGLEAATSVDRPSTSVPSARTRPPAAAVVAPVVGSSALQIEMADMPSAEADASERADVLSAAAPDVEMSRPAAAAAPSSAPPPVNERPRPARAAGVRRPVVPVRRDPQPALADSPSAELGVVEPTGIDLETPDRGIAPQWAPVGRQVRRADVHRPAAARPRRQRHERAGFVWTWRTTVKVLVAAIMLTVLAIWLGTLAQAHALSPALGAVALLGTPGPKTRPGTRRRRPTSG